MTCIVVKVNANLTQYDAVSIVCHSVYILSSHICKSHVRNLNVLLGSLCLTVHLYAHMYCITADR